jgi:hypothetical protein
LPLRWAQLVAQHMGHVGPGPLDNMEFRHIVPFAEAGKLLLET